MTRSALARRATLVIGAALVAVLALAVAGCARPAPGPGGTPAPVPAPRATLPTEPAGITGTITSVESVTADSVVILVEGGPQPVGAYADKARVTVKADVPVFGPKGEASTASELRKGAEVRVWFEGAVAESYPIQGGAKAVQITRAANAQ